MCAAQGPFKKYDARMVWRQLHVVPHLCGMDSVAQLAIHKAFFQLPTNLPHLHANYTSLNNPTVVNMVQLMTGYSLPLAIVLNI